MRGFYTEHRPHEAKTGASTPHMSKPLRLAAASLSAVLVTTSASFGFSGDVPPAAPTQTPAFPPIMTPPVANAAPVEAPAHREAVAVTPLTGEEFDARTLGKTIHYDSMGAPYGVEEYLPDRKVKWIFSEGKCKMGEWYQAGNQICFEYDDDQEVQCWIFADQPQGLMAWFKGNLADAPLISKTETTTPLDCEMIDFGV